MTATNPPTAIDPTVPAQPAGADHAVGQATGPVVPTIVGAAILDADGRVLGAERSSPPSMAGMWEFPGGKVEPGESELDAVRRECEEELGVAVEVGERLGQDIVLPSGWVLKVWIARLVRGEPRALEHNELRWLSPEELDDVPWLPADAPLVEALRARQAPGEAR